MQFCTLEDLVSAVQARAPFVSRETAVLLIDAEIDRRQRRLRAYLTWAEIKDAVGTDLLEWIDQAAHGVDGSPTDASPANMADWVATHHNTLQVWAHFVGCQLARDKSARQTLCATQED